MTRERKEPRKANPAPGPIYAGRGPSESPETSFEEGNFEDLLVLNRAMAEVTVLAEQLAVVGGDRDV
jgi:hypothetical protein